MNALLNLIPNFRKRKIVELYKGRNIINGKDVTDNQIDNNDCAGKGTSIESETKIVDTHADNLLDESNEMEVTEEQNQHLYDPKYGNISEILDGKNLYD